MLGVGFTMTGLFDSALLLGGTVMIWTLGEVIGAPVGSAFVAALASEHLRGRCQGALGSTYSIALMLAPLIGTPAVRREADGLVGVVRSIVRRGRGVRCADPSAVVGAGCVRRGSVGCAFTRVG